MVSMGQKSQPKFALLMTMFLALASDAMAEGQNRARRWMSRFAADRAGAINTGALLAIVTVIIGAVVGLSLIAALAPTYMSSLASFVGVFTDANATTGDATADALLPVFGLLMAFVGLFAIVGLGIIAVRLRKGN